MANALRGEASFEHDFGSGAETLTVVFTTATFLEIEDATGIGLLDIEQGMRKLGFLAALLAAGLAIGGRTLSREDAAELLLQSETAGQAVRDALNRALPNARDPASGDARARPPKAAGKSGTGKKS